jgi:hypothetical protein
VKTRSRILKFDNFSQGLKIDVPYVREANIGLEAVKDMYCVEGRGLSMAFGGNDRNSTWTGMTSPSTELFARGIQFTLTPTSFGFVVVRGQGKVWAWNWNTSSVSDITGGAVALSSPPGLACMAVGDDGSGTPMVFSTEGFKWQGVGNIAAWTASTGTLPSSGGPLVYANNRLYGTNGGNMLKWSDADDPNSWTTTNFVELDRADGQLIVSIVPFGPYLLVGKQSKTFLVYDLDTGANRVLSNTIGTLSHDSAVSTPYGVIFLGQDGQVHLADAASVKTISSGLGSVMARQLAQQRRNAVGYYHDDWYELAFHLNTDRHFRYHIPSDSWWESSLHAVNGNAPISWGYNTLNHTHWALYDDIGSHNPVLRNVFVQTATDGLNPSFQLPYINLAGPIPRTRIRSVAVRTGFSGSHTLTLKDETGATLWTRSQSPTNGQVRIFGTGPSGLARAASLSVSVPADAAVTNAADVIKSVEFEIIGRAD